MAYKRISPAPVIEGGTGQSTLTAHGVLLGNGTSGITQLSVASTGQTLMGSTGADPAFTGSPSFSGSVTAGTGLTVTTGGASITGNSTINGGTVGIGSDNANNTISIGTASAAGRTINIGNTTGTSGISELVGTGNFSLDGAASSTYAIGASTTTGTITIGGTAQTGTITLGSSSGTNTVAIGAGTGATTVNIATGATNAKTVSIATGAVANTVTIGSTSGAASLNLKSGSGNIISNSGFTVDSSGRNYNTTQPAFSAYLSSATSNNVTGDGTGYSIIFDQTIYNVGTSYNTGTGVFTAPIAGLYYFNLAIMAKNIGSHDTLQLQINTATQSFQGSYCNPSTMKANGNFLQVNMAQLIKLSASDTVSFAIVVAGSTKTVGINGGGALPSQQFTYVSGCLIA